MSKYNLDVMDGERLLLDGRGKRLSQGCDKNAQRRKRDRILQEWTYMPDSIRRKERRNIGKTKKDRLRNARTQDTEWSGRLGEPCPDTIRTQWTKLCRHRMPGNKRKRDGDTALKHRAVVNSLGFIGKI